MADTYGEDSLGIFFSSLMKVWNNWSNFAGLSLGHWSKRSLIKSGVRFGLGWNYNISLMDSAMIVNRTFWL